MIAGAVLTTVLPVVGCGSAAVHAWTLRTLSRTRGSLADANRRAETDPLTGLANRAGLRQAVNQFDGEEYDLVLIDLDHFKQVNDTYGHDAGDLLLVEVAHRFAGTVAEIEDAIAARLGGDEFVVVAPCAEPLVQLLGEDIIQALAAPVTITDGVQVEVRASLGGIHVVDADLDTALSNVDTAVYEVKARGGDGLVVHENVQPLPVDPARPTMRTRDLIAFARSLGATA